MRLSNRDGVPCVLGGQGGGEARLGVKGRGVGARGHALGVALEHGAVHAADELLHLGSAEACLLGEDLCLGDELLQPDDEDVPVQWEGFQRLNYSLNTFI